MPLDPNSPVPLYHQLAEALRRQLARERWAIGRKLPSEHELCRAYGVTRPTVRQALDGLLREGLVITRRGLGTFVAEPKPPVGLFALVGTTEAFTRQRMRVATKVLAAEVVHGCPLAEEEAPPARWLRLERLRSVNGTAALLERTWIRQDAAPGLDRIGLENRSLYQTLRERFGLAVEGGAQRFGATAADARVARELKVKRGAPLLRVTRRLDLTGHPGALRVELLAADGPFILEERLPGRAGAGEFAARRGA